MMGMLSMRSTSVNSHSVLNYLTKEWIEASLVGLGW